jgi:hypothetical protein
MIRRRKKKPRPAGPGLSALTSAEGDLGVVLKWKLRGFAERGPLAWRDPIGEVRLVEAPHWVPLDRGWGTFGHGNHYV